MSDDKSRLYDKMGKKKKKKLVKKTNTRNGGGSYTPFIL